MKKKQPGTPVLSIKSPSGIRYLPKIHKDKDGNWSMLNPEPQEGSTPESSKPSEKT